MLSIDIPIINVDSFISEYKKRHKDFSIGGNTVNSASEQNLRDILSEINKFYILTGEFSSKKTEIGSLNYFNKYDPILATTSILNLS